MILIGIQGKFTVWFIPASNGYRFCGGKFGQHEINCNRVLHDDRGLFGRAEVHFIGYKANG